MTIGTTGVSDQLNSRWGIDVVDYVYDGKLMDLQDLLVSVSLQKGLQIEKQVSPMAVRMQRSNAVLEQVGKTFSKFSSLQTQFDQSQKDSDEKSFREVELVGTDIETLVFCETSNTWEKTRADGGKTYYTYRRSACDGVVQRLRTKMDALNNAAQTFMTRLQGLVDKRDNMFTAASQLMGSVSDTRKNLISSII